MPWNIETLNSLISFTHKAPLFSVPMQEHLSKMVGLNINTATYLTLLGLSSFLSHVLNVFWGKPPSPLFTPSTVFHPQFSKMSLPLNVFMVLHLHILLFTSLVVHALFYFSRTNIPNQNLDLVYVVFLGIGLNTKVIVVEILSLNVFSFLVILFSGNIPHLILSLSFKLVPPLPFLPIHLYLCFLMLPLQILLILWFLLQPFHKLWILSLIRLLTFLLLLLLLLLQHLHQLWILSLIRLLTFLLLLLLLTLRFLPKTVHHPWILLLIRLLSFFVVLTG